MDKDTKECGGSCCKKGDGCSKSTGSCCKKDEDASPANNSELNEWPIQLQLIDTKAEHFKEADLVISADCAPFAFADFHKRFLKGKKLISLCPKLATSHELYVNKLEELFKEQSIRTVTLIRMEDDCCGDIESIAEEALNRSGVNVLIKEYVISANGEIV